MLLLYLYTDVKIYFQITTCNPTYNSNWNSFDDLHGHHFVGEVSPICPNDRFTLLCRRSWLRLQHAMTVRIVLLMHHYSMHTHYHPIIMFIVGVIWSEPFFIPDIWLFGHVYKLLGQCRHRHRRKRSSMERQFTLSKYLRRTRICSTLPDDLAETFIPPGKLCLIRIT